MKNFLKLIIPKTGKELMKEYTPFDYDEAPEAVRQKIAAELLRPTTKSNLDQPTDEQSK